jgi:hypothetical protein
MPCYRGKVTDAVLFRSGGLELTKRWKGTEMRDVTDRINPKDIRTIKFTLGICEEPITVEVVAFQPQSGDVTARYWMVPDGELGVRKKKDLAHYCLFSIQKTADYFEEYIKKHAVNVMKLERAGGKGDPRDILERTYDYIIKRYQDLSVWMDTTCPARSVCEMKSCSTVWGHANEPSRPDSNSPEMKRKSSNSWAT